MPLRPDFVTWWSAEEYRSECTAYVNRRAEKLARRSSLTEAEARDMVREAVDCIVRGRHTDLVNSAAAMSMVVHFLRAIRSSRLLSACWDGIRSTHVGAAARHKIMARIRSVSETPLKNLLPGVTEDVVEELTGVLAFITDFHAARQPSAEG